MKLKRILVAIFCLATVFALVGCNESGSTNSGGTKVIFELEGGTYKNSTYAITHTYKLEEGEETYIVTPEQLNKNKYDVKRSGYSLVGWFRSKSGEGESAEYSEQFNFETDKIGVEGITLYAKWEKIIKYRYTVGYMDGEDFVAIDSYTDVSTASLKFDDYLNYSEERTGYTSIKSYSDKKKKWVADYYDINGNAWDENFEHPLDEENPEVKVVVKYVKGKDIEFVRNKEDLLKVTNKSIYLLGNIDMEGEELSFGKDGEYKDKYFYGNGYTISNFKLSYKLDAPFENLEEGDGEEDALYVSIFGTLEKSIVENVIFDNFTVQLGTKDEYGAHNTFVKKLYFAPITISAIKSTVSGVQITNCSVTYSQTDFHSGFDMDDLYIKTDREYYKKDGDSSFTDCELSLTVTNQD